MHNARWELPRISVPRTWVNKPGFGVVLALLLGDALQGLLVPYVDPTPLQLHDPLVLEPPQGTGHRHPVGPYHGAKLLVGVGGWQLVTSSVVHHPLVLAQPQDLAR
jgi:hypothetical protein